ncbi:MAG: beta-propeller fold lactonase family protein [Phycisphaerales bacterium]
MRTTRGLVLAAGLAALAPFAAAQPTVRSLYVTNNVGSPGSIAAFEVESDGALTSLGNALAGFNPQGIDITPDGRFVVVINGTQNDVVEEVYALPLNADGTIGMPALPVLYPDGNLSLEITADGWIIIPAVDIDGATSSFINANGQVQEVDRVFAGTFPTCAESTPDGRFVYIGGSGSNNLFSFLIEPSTGELTPLGIPVGATTNFALTAHPTLPVIYASTGLQNRIDKYDIQQDGSLALDQGFPSGATSAVEAAIHPEGTYLYVCHVVSDALTVLPVNADGTLGASIQTVPVGSDIRDVVTDGEFVYVTDESSIGGSPVGVLVYEIGTDGTLTQVGPAAPTNGGRPQYMALWNPPADGCDGDTNGDNIVNFADLNTVVADFGMQGQGLAGDVNGDGIVNFEDLNTVLANFGTTCG